MKRDAFLTSHLEGEVCFQCEQKSASVRKQGEGLSKVCAFDPSLIFLALESHAEKSPSLSQNDTQSFWSAESQGARVYT